MKLKTNPTFTFWIILVFNYFWLQICSWVGNEIQFVHLQVMLHKFLLIECVIMAWECFRDNWFDFLCLYLWPAHKLEALVVLLISGLTLEHEWFIRLQGNHVGTAPTLILTYLPKHIVVFSQLPLLFFTMVDGITGVTLEWEGIEGILWVLLVVNITFTVLPVRKVLHIGWLSYYWFAFIFESF